MSDTPQAGWYPDPEDSTQQRYWDGQQWTDHRAPLSGAGQQPSSSTPSYGEGQQPAWGAGGQQPSYGGYQPAGPTGVQNNQKAIWALVLGILSLVCCGFVTGIPAIILGRNAKQEIAASGGAQSGEGMAQAGFICGIIGTVLAVIGIIFYVIAIATIGIDAGFDTGGF